MSSYPTSTVQNGLLLLTHLDHPRADTEAAPLSQRNPKSTAYHPISSTSYFYQRKSLPSFRTSFKPSFKAYQRPHTYIIRTSIFTTTMHFHAIVLAAVSAGVLSVHLVEKNYLTSKGLPNVSCEGKNAGESASELKPSVCLLLFAKPFAGAPN